MNKYKKMMMTKKLHLQKKNWMFNKSLKDRFGDIGKVKNDKTLGPGHYPSE